MNFDYAIKSTHRYSNRVTTTQKMILSTLLLVLIGCNGQSADPWERYVRSIDEHIEAYVQFSENDPQLSNQILDQYERAKQIRANYHRDGTIPDDPLVQVITSGDNLFVLEDSYVGVFLAPDASLECSGLDFSKEDGVAGQYVVVGGNKGFWERRSEDAKFISTTVTLPVSENTLRTQSNSWTPGKIIVIAKAAAAVAVVLGLTGCTGDDEGPAPNPAGGGCSQPTSAVTIAEGTLLATAKFGLTDPAAAAYITGAGMTAATTALNAKMASLSANKCTSPCAPTWTPTPTIADRSQQINIGAGRLIVFLEVAATSTLSCV